MVYMLSHRNLKYHKCMIVVVWLTMLPASRIKNQWLVKISSMDYEHAQNVEVMLFCWNAKWVSSVSAEQ